MPRLIADTHQLPAPSAFFVRRWILVSKRRRPRAASATPSTCLDGRRPSRLVLVKVPLQNGPRASRLSSRSCLRLFLRRRSGQPSGFVGHGSRWRRAPVALRTLCGSSALRRTESLPGVAAEAGSDSYGSSGVFLAAFGLWRPRNLFFLHLLPRCLVCYWPLARPQN